MDRPGPAITIHIEDVPLTLIHDHGVHQKLSDAARRA
jgi:hypothetical protein